MKLDERRGRAVARHVIRLCDHERVLRCGARIVIVAALVATLFGATAARGESPPVTAGGPPLFASVSDTPTGRPMPAGFVGLSLEYPAIHVYTGRDPTAIDPVLLQLIRQLAPGQAPVLRIGGDSTDSTWWPIRGVIPPGGVTYGLNKGWLRTTRALAADLGAHLVLGVNLAADRPALSAAEARALLEGVGAKYITAFELGNEPDLYGVYPWYRNRRGQVFFSRPHTRYHLNGLIKDYSQWTKTLPQVPLAGPALSGPDEMSGLGGFLTAQPRVRLVTYHQYALRACVNDPSASSFASIPNLLLDSSSSGLAQRVAPYVAVAHARGLPFRLDELNSASCRGRPGVSNTFASALWAVDTLFDLASVGVDGVNIHSLPGSAYEFASFAQFPGGWQAFVHPVYYGLMLFAQAFPPRAQLLSVTAPSGPVKIWATRAPDGTTRVVLINKDATAEHSVQLQLPGAEAGASLEWLQAPSVDSTSGVTLGGQTFGSQTTTGAFPGPQTTTPVYPSLGSYSIDLPPASAVMLTR
jgi:Glycosyl hydrolase family 79 C-terminal beta domain